MALPELTAEQQQAAAEKAQRVRYERTRLLSQVKTGDTTVAALLDRTGEPVVGGIRVRQALRALPGIGPKRADTILAEAGIDPKRKIQGLGTRQRAALVSALA